MKYKTLCPHCGTVVEEDEKYEVLFEYFGLWVKYHCPHCGANFYIQQTKYTKENK